ncbi:MAG TPA: hypothetical protein PK295_01850 [Candidatus Magasanikbacteria bacterium]|nr:hypothetical protein [Candidatus Magasanikbacteria bacterium]
MKKMYHIHVDAQSMDAATEDELIKAQGFELTNFSGHPTEILHFEPNRHLTFKCTEIGTFKRTFDQTRTLLANSNMRGYLEGEFIASDEDIPHTPFNAEVPLNLQIQVGALEPGKFRATELHISLDKDRSDPRLIQRLCKTGLYGAYLPKAHHTALVLTAQGSRTCVGRALEILGTYLRAAGGGVACSIKEERILRWWTSHNDIVLPPIIANI